MMSNLFSIFDPSTSFSLPLNWVSVFLGLFMLPYLFWFNLNRYQIFLMTIIKQLDKEFKTLIGPSLTYSQTLIFISLLSVIAMNNIMGLFPYVFTATSHLSLTLSLALPLWLSFMFYGWFNHTQHMLAHMVPLGTPTLLMPFMVLIETISNIIRPGTLAVRLAANMIAGHLLLVLLGNQGPAVSSPILVLLLGAQILLLTLESAVALIQSYVFAVLATLYSSEVSYDNSF